MAAAVSWEEFLAIKGEINALNTIIEFGDQLVDRLEEAVHRVGSESYE
jgi:hypothetical protein